MQLSAKKIWRIAAVLVLGVVVMLGLTAAVCLDDYSPLERMTVTEKGNLNSQPAYERHQLACASEKHTHKHVSLDLNDEKKKAVTLLVFSLGARYISGPSDPSQRMALRRQQQYCDTKLAMR